MFPIQQFMETLARSPRRRIPPSRVYHFMRLVGDLFQEFAWYADSVADCINFVSSEFIIVIY